MLLTTLTNHSCKYNDPKYSFFFLNRFYFGLPISTPRSSEGRRGVETGEKEEEIQRLNLEESVKFFVYLNKLARFVLATSNRSRYWYLQRQLNIILQKQQSYTDICWKLENNATNSTYPRHALLFIS